MSGLKGLNPHELVHEWMTLRIDEIEMKGSVFICIIQQELMKHLQNQKNQRELTGNQRTLSEPDLQDCQLHSIL